MRLIYVWAKEYNKMSATGRQRNNFEFEDGLTVASDYIVRFSYEKCELFIEKRSTRIEKFFGDTVNDVIAIVGKNGSGKTTVLSMLATESSNIQYEHDYSDREYIKIFEEDDKTLIIYFSIKKKLRFSVERNIKVNCIDLRERNMTRKKIENRISSIFISNNFEWRDFYGLPSIRMEEGILEYNFAKKMEELMFHPEDAYGADIEDTGSLRKINDYGINMERKALDRVALYQVRLLVASMRSIPAKVRREFSGVYDSFNVGVKDFTLGFDFFDDNKVQDLMMCKECIDYKETRYLLFACYQVLLCEAIYFFGSSIQKLLRAHFSKEKEEIVDVDLLRRVSDKLKKDITVKKAKFDITKLQWFHQFNDSIEIFDKYKEERFYIGAYPFASSNGKRFLDFLSDVFSQNNKFFERILTFKSYPASTGESVLANFFAYIYDAISYKTTNKDIVIYIDEIDANLHPRWQQLILWYLLEYLNSLVGYQFQIIFTTHSPIILSDLTEERIIRLDRNKNNIKSISNKQQTFGANIMRLYYDDFFMENGSIGEFAKTKIKAVMDYINGKDNDISREEVKYIIDHIGEPTVNRQLKKMLNERDIRDISLERKVIELAGEMGWQEAINRLSQKK